MSKNPNGKPIDFVITWVDGDDPKWQSEKAKFLKQEHQESIDVSKSRYRDWELLKYWFRCIEKNTPWVNKVFFVTNGQKPEWLNTSYEKLVHINHADYMPKKYLPTFNSNSIELSLHKIKELSDNFVLFNDDMFIIEKLSPKFFFKNGLPCDALILTPTIVDDNTISTHIIINNLEYANKLFQKNKTMKENLTKCFTPIYGLKGLRTIAMMPFGKFVGFYLDHMPTSFTKEDYEFAWAHSYDIFEETSKNKFRTKNDINQWLIKTYRNCLGKFYPRNPKFGKSLTIKNNNLDEISHLIKNHKKKIICLNDGEDIQDFESTKKRLIEIFDSSYPTKSKFEK